ncbi:MAG: hypothetical protein ACI8UP_001623, partial [Porticoccaceae bacterium]
MAAVQQKQTSPVKAKKTASKKRVGKPSKAKVTKKSSADVMGDYSDAQPSDVSDKLFVASSELHGKGLFAAKHIKANTVLGRLVGMPTFDDGIYVLWITDDIGLELVNDFKFINHGKNPNAAYT